MGKRRFGADGVIVQHGKKIEDFAQIFGEFFFLLIGEGKTRQLCGAGHHFRVELAHGRD